MVAESSEVPMPSIAKIAKSSNRGSRPGERRGGRKKGTPNRKTAAMIKAVRQSGITPLDFMLEVMRGKPPEGAGPAEFIAFTNLRFEAAKAAAPYVHPKLSAIEHTGKDGGPVRAMVEVRFV
jgi:hypothetical protein